MADRSGKRKSGRARKSKSRRPSPLPPPFPIEGKGIVKLTHLDESGEAHMVDVGAKPASARRAVAEGTIRMQPRTLALIQEGGHKKGDVLAVARVAGIMAAKRTAELIPLCHPIPITAIEIHLTPVEKESAIHCRAEAATIAQTGVEMEALTAVATALLAVYDMCKAVDRGMTITDIRLLAKSGGRSGKWKREDLVTFPALRIE